MISLTRVAKLVLPLQHPLGVSYASLGSHCCFAEKARGFKVTYSLDSSELPALFQILI